MINIRRLFLQLKPYRFSKLLHFCQNYPMYEFDAPKFTINRFQVLLDGATEGNSQRFNIAFTKYLNNHDDSETDTTQLNRLLKAMYENNIHCSKQNKDWFLNLFKQRQLNSENIEILLQYQLIGINNQELTNLLVSEFQILNLQNLSFSDRLSLAFLIGSIIKKYPVDTQSSYFQQKWSQLVTFLVIDANSNDTSYVNKYQYLAQVIKSYTHSDPPMNKNIVEDLRFIFERLTQNFKNQTAFNLLPTKDTAILLTCCLKIKESMLNEEMSLIIYNILMYLAKADLSEFNNVSLYTIILSLTHLIDFQKSIGENIVQVLKQRIQANNCTPKYYLAVFAEIYARWEVPLPRDHLAEMIQFANVLEFTETDLANYLQLLALLPIETIISTLNQIEQPLYQKYQRKKDLWPNRQDQPSVEKIKRYLSKFNQMAVHNARKLDSFERLTKLIQ